MREAHGHVGHLGRALDMIRLDDVGSSEQMLERLGGDRPWILAVGARPESWSDDWPSLRRLDEATGDRPCCIWCFDHHAMLVNSEALRLASIDASTPDPEGGLIVRDDRGHPTGLLLEKATPLVWNVVPPDDEATRLDQLRRALAHLVSFGFDEVHDMHAPHQLALDLASIERTTSLPLRVSLYAPLDDLEAMHADRSFESDRLRLVGGKLFADGTLNSRTAWMLEPYADPIGSHPTGTALVTPSEIDESLARCDALGLELAVHAIGDGAVRAVLDGVERRRPATRVRIEHAEIIDDSDVPRFASLGVIASVQPCHLLADVEALERLLPHRLDRVLPVRDLLDTGAKVWFGSDVPIVRADPADSLEASTTRVDGRLAPAQAISIAEARACFEA